jgi:hypothetical protein
MMATLGFTTKKNKVPLSRAFTLPGVCPTLIALLIYLMKP